MKMQWEIRKRRGYHRPVLSYSIELEPFEIELAVPQVVLDKAVVRPPSAWRSFCHPGQDERAGALPGWHRLMTPSHVMKSHGETLTLPWRGPGATFGDVEEAFSRLRRDFEMVLTAAYDSVPLDIVCELELTDATRKHIASGVVTARFLAAAGF
ncbi:hypothetical protein [Pseudodesulfovibrio pelocollis]|uniref:hypothetical protein n=1 Tax=Pseudodesulfovibrio pelocollis TaxID=3051432 RepID=UPI00255A9B4E|nr:hypothetical protein [Pseudodesulfovibrio sp. SB368]